MSAAANEAAPVERVTLEQIKHRAEEIKDLAVVEVKEAAACVIGDDNTRTLLIVAGVVVVAVSVAYFLGARGRPRIIVDAG